MAIKGDLGYFFVVALLIWTLTSLFFDAGGEDKRGDLGERCKIIVAKPFNRV